MSGRTFRRVTALARGVVSAGQLQTRSATIAENAINTAPVYVGIPHTLPQPEPLDAPFPGYSLRASTNAVAQRLASQAEYPLLFGTPHTVDGALAESDQARIITEVASGHRVVFVNRAWEELCGFRASEVTGSGGCQFLQGPETESHIVQRINSAVMNGQRVRVTLTNYKKDGTPFKNHVQVSPLRDRTGRITHFLGILQELM